MNENRELHAGSSERGQTMAEYAMVLSVITLAIMLTIVALGDTAGRAIEKVTAYL